MIYQYNSHQDPYLALGLRRNPFTLESNFLLPTSLWIDRGWSVPPKPKDKRLIQLIGVKGAGKSSHLRRWQAQTDGPFCYYPPGPGRIKMPSTRTRRTSTEILYWDEGDRIPYPFLLSAFILAAQQHQTIAVGTHKDLGKTARRAGLSVSTIHIPPFDGQLLLAWVQRRIEAVTIKGQVCRLRLSKPEAERIAIAAKGSWRDAADELHIWAAQQANHFAESTEDNSTKNLRKTNSQSPKISATDY